MTETSPSPDVPGTAHPSDNVASPPNTADTNDNNTASLQPGPRPLSAAVPFDLHAIPEETDSPAGHSLRSSVASSQPRPLPAGILVQPSATSAFTGSTTQFAAGTAPGPPAPRTASSVRIDAGINTSTAPPAATRPSSASRKSRASTTTQIGYMYRQSIMNKSTVTFTLPDGAPRSGAARPSTLGRSIMSLPRAASSVLDLLESKIMRSPDIVPNARIFASGAAVPPLRQMASVKSFSDTAGVAVKPHSLDGLIIEIICLLALSMVEYGAPLYRVEGRISGIAEELGIDIQLFILPSHIFFDFGSVQLGDSYQKRFSIMRTTEDWAMAKLQDVDRLARELCFVAKHIVASSERDSDYSVNRISKFRAPPSTCTRRMHTANANKNSQRSDTNQSTGENTLDNQEYSKPFFENLAETINTNNTQDRKVNNAPVDENINSNREQQLKRNNHQFSGIDDDNIAPPNSDIDNESAVSGRSSRRSNNTNDGSENTSDSVIINVAQPPNVTNVNRILRSAQIRATTQMSSVDCQCFSRPSSGGDDTKFGSLETITGHKAGVCSNNCGCEYCGSNQSNNVETTDSEPDFKSRLGYIDDSSSVKESKMSLFSNSVSVEARCALESILDDLKNIKNRNSEYHWSLKILSNAMGSFTLCVLLYKGSWADGLVSFLFGILASIIVMVSYKFGLDGAVETITAFVVAAIARAIEPSHVWSKISGTGNGLCHNTISLAGVCSLLPGFAIALGMLEISSSNPASGVVRIGQAFVKALKLGFGLSLGSALVIAIYNHTSSWTFDDTAACSSNGPKVQFWRLPLWIPMNMGILIVLKARPRQWLHISVTSLIGYTVSLVVYQWLTFDITAGITAFCLAIVANTWARWQNDIAIAGIFAGMYWLVPGGTGVLNAVKNLSSTSDGSNFALVMLTRAMSISIGLYMANMLAFPLSTKDRSRQRRQDAYFTA